MHANEKRKLSNRRSIRRRFAMARQAADLKDPMTPLMIRARVGGKRRTVNRERRTFKRSVRELRQRRAYYRCCIPALAGFVSLRSIAPDGFVNTRMDSSSEQRLFLGELGARI